VTEFVSWAGCSLVGSGGFVPTDPGTPGVTDSRSLVMALRGMAYGLKGREEHDQLGCGGWV
jgi:hypothetical protein